MIELELNTETFASRIIGMMADYNITMFDALLWEFEGFGFNAEKIYEKNGLKTLEFRFRNMLTKNGLKEDDQGYYVGIFMGTENNVELKK